MKRLTLILTLIVSLQAQAQNKHPLVPFEHISVPGTVNSSQVSDLLQDDYGLIWVAAEGLSKYDGYRFTQYKQLASGENITGTEIKYLFSDKQNKRLLLGTNSYGIVQYDYATDKLSPLPVEGGFPIITHISQTTDGTIWASSFSNGLYYLESDTLKKVHDSGNRLRNITSIHSVGNKLLVDNLSNIYVLQNKSVIDSIKLQFSGYVFPELTRVTAMASDKKGHLWMGTDLSGILVYDTLQKKFIKHLTPEKDPFYNRINRIFVDRNNTVWILFKSGGIVVFSPDVDDYIHIKRNPLAENTLSGNTCNAILQDKTGIIWIASTGDLNLFDATKIKFKHIYNNPFSLLSLSDNMVRSIYEDRNRKLWVGTDGGIINIIDRAKIRVERVELKIPSLKQHIVPMYFQELNENTVLIGSPSGLFQFDVNKKHLTYFAPLKEVIGKRQVRQILKEGNTLYFLFGASLAIYNLESRDLQRYVQFGSLSPKNGSANNPSAIYLDSQKRLWVGHNKGVSLFNPADKTFQIFPIEINVTRPLGSRFMVLSLNEVKDSLWIGTFNSGLYSLALNNLSTPALKHFTDKDGLPNNTVYAVLPDEEGNLWMSTNQGIAKYETKKNRFLNFTTADGLQHAEFNRLAYVRCASGELVFGGINGLNIFNPKQISIKDGDYTPHLLSASVFMDNENNSRFIGLTQQPSLLLPHQQNDLDFTFFVPNYASPRRFETYYKLLGLDPDWIRTETNTIHYSNLKPGTYNLQVKTISSLGTEKLCELPVVIQYPFWQTWWFILLSALIASFMVFTIIQNNIRKTKHDKERLESLLKQRTQEIEKSREELENLNQKKDLIFSILSHDLRSPLTTLKGFLSILIDDSDYLSKEEIQRHAINIRNSVSGSLDLIDNTLFWSLSQTGNITYTPSSFSLDEMLRKIATLYQLTAEKKQLDFSVETEEKIMVHGDENMIYVTLRNLVSNAVKYTAEGKGVKIKANRNHSFAEITIYDEGIGMSESYIEKLMSEEHLPLKKGTSNEKGTGLGLILCKKFIQLNHGQLQVNSVEGKGTEFTVKLPLSQA
ncbi:MAG: two-component regulator propeller domain-containing protein [Cyclobacteriaceae bacterium]